MNSPSVSSGSARVLDGRSLAQALRQDVSQRVAEFRRDTGVQPQLAAVLVGEDAASQVYVRNKRRACDQAGIASQLLQLPASAGTRDPLDIVRQLNQDAATHGILVQLPLPPAFDTQSVLDAVDPLKDVDGFHPVNVGLLSQGRPRFIPCTPLGVLHLLHHNQVDIRGRHAVVVGRSDIVGRPMAALLSQKSSPVAPTVCDATVTVCHSRTGNLAEFTRQADLLVVAIGRPQSIDGAMIKPGAAVVDVGINRVGGQLVGDVHFPSAARTAGWITPVPGGVGPLTVAMLLANTLSAASQQTQAAL